jgi:hypothetical protein
MIKGGYILQPRIIKNSEIYHMSPCSREVWALLLRNAKYEDDGSLKRGQCFISIDDIRDELCWYVGYRKETYSRRSIEGTLKVLREKEMIVTTKVTHGMLITICKYDYYQDPENYERNNEGGAKVTTKVERTEKSEVDIKKNIKNEESKKEEISLSPKVEKTWKNDFETYLKITTEAYHKLIADEDFIKQQEKYYPNVDIYLSIQKAVNNFWGKEAGWAYKKRQRIKDIDMASTLTNAIEKNRVWKNAPTQSKLRMV